VEGVAQLHHLNGPSALPPEEVALDLMVDEGLQGEEEALHGGCSLSHGLPGEVVVAHHGQEALAPLEGEAIRCPGALL